MPSRFTGFDPRKVEQTRLEFELAPDGSVQTLVVGLPNRKEVIARRVR